MIDLDSFSVGFGVVTVGYLAVTPLRVVVSLIRSAVGR